MLFAQQKLIPIHQFCKQKVKSDATLLNFFLKVIFEDTV